MISREVDATHQLEVLISGTFYPADAMKLVQLGANPNTQRANGDSLLHITIATNVTQKERPYDALIEELVQKYHANIHIENNAGQTPLQCLISGIFYPADAMKLVRLGADPNTRRTNGDSLLHITIATNVTQQERPYDALIEELHYYFRRYERNNPQRSNFLNLLILLANERSNTKTKEGSIFRRLPMDIIRYIISFLDLESIGRTSQEAQALATEIFSESAKIKMMARAPGGINVFEQKDAQTHRSKFTFFKSVTILILDYKKLEAGLIDKDHIPKLKRLLGTKLTPESQTRLSEFKKYTIKCWHLQSSLFPADKLQLHKAIKDSKLEEGLAIQGPNRK